MSETSERPVPTPIPHVIHEFATLHRPIVGTEPSPDAQAFIRAHGLERILAHVDLTHLDWYAYHNLDHNLDVEMRALELLEIVLKTVPELVMPTDWEIVRITGQGHDVRVKHSLGMDYGMLSLLQLAGESERETAEVIEGYMRECNRRALAFPHGDAFRQLYTKIDIQKARACVISTIPSFINGRVIQEHLRPGTPLPAVMIALSDLGAAMDGASAFKRSSNNLLRERFVGIRLLLMRAQAGEPLTSEVQDLIADVILGWTRSQQGFLEGRIAQLPVDMEAIGDIRAREAVLKRMLPGHLEAAENMARVVLPRREAIVGGRGKDWHRRLLIDCDYPHSLLR